MVTTRGQDRDSSSAKKDNKALDTIDPASKSGGSSDPDEVFYTPATEREGGYNGVGEDDEFYTPAGKRQKILPVREKQEKMHQKTRIVVEIPVKSGAVKMESSSKKAQDDHADKDVARHKLNKHQHDGSDEGESHHGVAERATAADKVLVDGANPDQVHGSGPRHKRLTSQEAIQSRPETDPTALLNDDSAEESSDDDAPEIVAAKDAQESTRNRERGAAKAAHM
jgi:hypothetical protein